MIHNIGDTAGKVYSILKKGPLSLSKLKKETNRDEKVFVMALGWLARENKITFTKKGNFLTISLKD